ncbi:MAG: hypothetical protein LBP39_00645 [Rickettsiales bacterium]|jgi:hypothetical protein|nr:hypothetical protein [Rickettsiales bacterium]
MSDKDNGYELYKERFIDIYESEIARFTDFPPEDERCRSLNSKDIAKNTLIENLDIIWSSRAIKPLQYIGYNDVFFETDLHGDMRAFLNTLCETGAVKYKDGEDALIFYNPEVIRGEQETYTLSKLEALKNSSEAKFKEEYRKLMKKLQPLANVVPTERYSRYINCGDFMDRGKQSEQMIHMIHYLDRQCKKMEMDSAKLIIGNHELYYMDSFSEEYTNGGGCCTCGYLNSISKKSPVYEEKTESLERAVKKAVENKILTLAHSVGTTIFSHVVITKKMVQNLACALNQLVEDRKRKESLERQTEEKRLTELLKKLEEEEKAMDEEMEEEMDLEKMLSNASEDRLIEEVLKKIRGEKYLEEILNRLTGERKKQEEYIKQLIKEEAINISTLERFRGKYDEFRAKQEELRAKQEELRIKQEELREKLREENKLNKDLDKLTKERRNLADDEVGSYDIGKLAERFTELSRKIDYREPFYGNDAKNLADALNEFSSMRSKIFKDFIVKSDVGLSCNANSTLGERQLFEVMKFSIDGITWNRIDNVRKEDLISGLRYIVGHDPEIGRFGEACSSDLRFSERHDNRIILADCMRSAGYNDGLSKTNYAIAAPQFISKEVCAFSSIFKEGLTIMKKQITKGDSAKVAEKAYGEYLKRLPIEQTKITKEKIAAGPGKPCEKFLENGPQNKESWRQQLSNESQEPKDNTMGGPGGV